jgi:hypothetical protein
MLKKVLISALLSVTLTLSSQKVALAFDAVKLTDLQNSANWQLVSNEEQGLVIAIEIIEENWWENLHIGKIENNQITWLEIIKLPTAQSIRSARFVNLKGFKEPLIEIYDQTHQGNGAIYLYQVSGEKVSLLAESKAVDLHLDYRFNANNFAKQGYFNCGQVFEAGQLTSNYQEVDQDGFADLVLTGTLITKCFDQTKINGKYQIDPEKELVVSEESIEKVKYLKPKQESWSLSTIFKFIRAINSQSIG